MFSRFWRVVWKTVIVVGVVLSVLFLAELLRLFIFFYRVNPILGWCFAGAVGAGILFLIYQTVREYRANPRVLVPPPWPPPEGVSHKAMRDYCKYLVRYLRRLAENPSLDDDAQDAADQQAEYVEDVLAHHPLNDDLTRTIEQTEANVIVPLLASLNEQATAEVRASVRDVMLGVVLSPYPSVDLLIVLYRNAAMVLRVIRIHRSRPRLREQLLIFRDILLAVATINFMNISRKLIESLFAHLPMVGRIVDDMGQGLGAGLLTSVTGHAAINRCAAFRGWNKEEQTASLASSTGQFLANVRDIFTKDLLPDLKGRIQASAPQEAAGKPGFWDSIVQGVASAVDATARALGTLIVRPAVAGVQGVAAVSSMIGRGVMRAGNSVRRSSTRPLRGMARVAHVFGQRLKYTVLGHGPNRADKK